jgi:VanZ family protein
MRKLIAAMLFIMVLTFMFLIMIGVFSQLRGWVYANSTNDKLAHIVFAAILTLLANVMTHPRKVRVLSIEVLLGTFLMAAWFFIDEFLQWPMPGRDANPLDLAASYAGLLLGAGVFRLWYKVSHRKQSFGNKSGTARPKDAYPRDV